MKANRQTRNRGKASGTVQAPMTKRPLADRSDNIARDDFLTNEALSDIDRHFARFMERLSGGANPLLAKAAALASHFQGQGSICVDLRNVGGTLFPTRNTGDGVGVPLPELSEWLPALRQSAVVGRPGEFKPLVLDDQGRLYLHRYWEYEAGLARAILHRAQETPQAVNEPLLQRSLDNLFPTTLASSEPEGQRVAASTAVRRKFCVISGGPGTGKTRTVIALLALLLEQAGDEPMRIALAAPTGKAAARLHESLQKWKATLPCPDEIKARLPDESFTLHRLLGGVPDSAKFKYNAENPLPFDVVVVDEASMVDLALMAKLFAAIPATGRLILLGDKDQLASVQAGAVLGDICHRPAGRISHPLADCIVELHTNYRFGAHNGILALSQAINRGDADRALELLDWPIGPDPAASDSPPSKPFARQPPVGDPALPEPAPAPPTGSGVLARPLPLPVHLKERLRLKVIESFSAVMRAGDPRAALNALSRFRILCAVRTGPFGIESLNRAAEEILFEARLISPGERWYAGRPVLVTRNDASLGLFNGDIGIILPDAASGELRAWFPGSDEIVRSLPPIRLPEHETVFAMTVHKSQGSEFDDVLIVLPDRESPVLTRELLYTGVTRASQRVELWFGETIFRGAVARRVDRTSGLRDALWGVAD